MNDAKALEAGCREPRAPFHPYWHAPLTATSRRQPGEGEVHLPCWVTTADIGIRDRPSRSITSATRTQSAGSSNADIFTIALLDQHLAGNLLLFNSIVSYSNEKIFFQSFFMLMMVQLFFFASA